jgi:protein phosphatase slingshot
MKEYGMSLEQAKRHVKERRSCINPNHGFLSQLKAYEGILKARYNNLFGSQVPSRITYQTRSSSDPNLRGKVEDDLSSIGGNKDTMEEGAESDETTATQEINEQLMMRVCESLPPEKVEGMQNYLATLEVPQIEEHDDLGINVPSSSESGSPFSSPLFTPPDEDSILSRIFNDNHSSSSNQRRKELGRSMDDNLLHITSSGRCYNMEYDRSTRATSVPLEATNNTCISPVKASIQSPLIQSPSPSNMDTIDYHQPAGTNTVTQRIKQIESLNKPMKQRPHSAGACIKRYDPLPVTMETPTSDMFPSNQEVPQQEEPPIIHPTTTTVLTQPCNSPTTRYKRAAEQSAILMEQKNISPKVDWI